MLGCFESISEYVLDSHVMFMDLEPNIMANVQLGPYSRTLSLIIFCLDGLKMETILPKVHTLKLRNLSHQLTSIKHLCNR